MVSTEITHVEALMIRSTRSPPFLKRLFHEAMEMVNRFAEVLGGRDTLPG